MQAMAIAGIVIMLIGSLSAALLIGVEAVKNEPVYLFVAEVAGWIFALGGVLFGLGIYLS